MFRQPTAWPSLGSMSTCVYPVSMAVVVDLFCTLSPQALLVVAAEYHDCNLFPDSEAPRASKGKE